MHRPFTGVARCRCRGRRNRRLLDADCLYASRMAMNAVLSVLLDINALYILSIAFPLPGHPLAKAAIPE